MSQARPARRFAHSRFAPARSWALAACLLAALSLRAAAQFQAPATSVGSTSATQTVTLTITTSGTLHAITVSTQGNTAADFRAVTPNGGSMPCSVGTDYDNGDTCTVQFTFSPSHPWTRYGGITLSDSSSTVLANAYLTGVGNGPQVSFPPASTAVPATVYTASTISPQAIAIDGSADVFFTDANFSELKELVAQSGSIGSNPTVNLFTGLGTPFGIAIDGSGNVFVSDTSANVIHEIVAVNGAVSPSSTIRTVASGFTSPTWLAIDPAGNLYVADSTQLKKVTVTGSVSTLVTFTGLGSVAVDASGNVYYIASTVLYKLIGGAGTPQTVASGISNAVGLAVDPAGNQYYANNSTGAIVEHLASSTISYPGFLYLSGVTIDAAGNLWVANADHSASGSIQELSLQTSPGLTFTSTAANSTSADSPQPLSVGNNGNTALTFKVPSGSNTNPTITTGFTIGGSSTCPQLTSASSAQTLAAGTTCTNLISFHPAFLGEVTGTLGLTDNHLNVTAATQSIALSGGVSSPVVAVSNASAAVDATSVTLSASVNYTGLPPTGTFTFSVNGGSAIAASCTSGSPPLTCTASVNPSSLTAGAYPITGSLAGDASTNAASASGTLTISAGTPAVSLGTSSATITVNSSVTFTASITPHSGIVPTGTVAFSSTLGGFTSSISGCTSVSLVSNAGNLTATCTTASLPAGAYTITATLSADANFNSATSAGLAQTVNKATPTVVTSSSGSPSVVNGSVIFTASVTPTIGIVPSGPVKFTTTLNSTTTTLPGCSSVTLVVGTSPSRVTATCVTSALAAGSNAINAALTADTNFNAASAYSITQVVNKNSPTNTIASSLPTTASLDQAITFTALITPANASYASIVPTGSVSFTNGSGGPQLCAATPTSAGPGTVTASCSATFTTALSAAPIYAVYTGDSNFNTGNSPSVAQTVFADSIWLVNANATTSRLSLSGTGLVNSGTSTGAATRGGIAVDASGSSWSVTAANNSLLATTKSGASTATYTGAGLSAPAAIAVDGTSTVWVANSTAASISAFKNTGTALTGTSGYAAASLGTSPSALAIDASGGVWVAAKTSGTITHILGVATPVTTPLAAALTANTLGTAP